LGGLKEGEDSITIKALTKHMHVPPHIMYLLLPLSILFPYATGTTGA